MVVYKIHLSGNLKIAGRKIVGVASVGDKNAFVGICFLSQSTFHVVCLCVYLTSFLFFFLIFFVFLYAFFTYLILYMFTS